MPRCCGGATCACSIIQGTHIKVDGSGSANDPFIITADVGAVHHDGPVFDVALTGVGTIADPWEFGVSFAPTARLDDIPDVNAPAPTNGQVLGWDTATQKWTARAPTTAASGSVDTDTSLSGDGSVGAPLAVVTDGTRFLDTTVAGVGIDDSGLNQMVLHYANAAVRAVSTVTPQINSVSMLDDTPGVQWYWTGSQWLPVTNGVARDFGTDALLQMSGAYANGVTTQMIRQVSVTTNADGTFDVLSATDISGAAGVLSAVFQETGNVPYKAVLYPNFDSIAATAYRLDDGSPYGAQAITGVVVAYIY